MPVGVPGDHLRMSRLGDPFAGIVVTQVEPQFVEQLVGPLIGQQMPVGLKKLFLPVLSQVVGNQQRAAAQCFENAAY